MRLAFEITKINYSREKAREAQEQFINIFQKKEMPDRIAERKLRIADWNIVDLLFEVDLASSKNEARRLIKQNGIKVDGRVVNDVNIIIKTTKKGILIQKGKRQFIRVIGN